MRPLVVLLLVLVAIVALVVSLNFMGGDSPSSTAVEPVAPPSEPAAPSRPAPEVETPDRAPTRVADSPEPVDGQADSEPRNRSNSLFGTVFNEQMVPLDGAVVQLSRDPQMGQEIAMMWITEKKPSGEILSTSTDNKGQYRFKNIEPRRDYYLIVKHKDFSPQQEMLIAVGEEGDFHGPDVVLKTGSMVVGVVTDEGGNAVPEATLWLDSAFYSGEGESPDRVIATTDALGHFEFKNVYAVTKSLTCMADGYGTQVKSPVNVEGKPGESVNVDFQLHVGQPIAGRVVGSDGAGIKGAQITAFNSGNNVSFRGMAVSKEDGQFEINGLHPGSYILQCMATGYRQQKHTRVATGSMTVQIDMLAQARVEGRVLDSASGDPVQNFTCSVRRVAPPQAGGISVSEDTGIQQTFTGRTDGSFSLSGLDPGTYAIKASAGDSAPTMSDIFSVVENQSVANIVVRLTRGGSITGRILGPDGAPIAGAVISSHDDQFDEDPMESIFGGLVPTNVTERKARSDREGKFELRLLTPEKYQIRIAHPNFTREKVRNLVVIEGQPTDVGAISLKLGGTLKGVVYDPAGKALPRGFVHLESAEGDLVYDVRTDGDGRYVFVHVRPGAYTLSATGQSSAGGGAFGAIIDQRQSQVQINVIEAGEITRDLNLGGG